MVNRQSRRPADLRIKENGQDHTVFPFSFETNYTMSMPLGHLVCVEAVFMVRLCVIA